MNQQKENPTALWSAQLAQVSHLRKASDHEAFATLMDSLTGEESTTYIDHLIDSIRVSEDHGAYESLYNALWRFPPRSLVPSLARHLPALQRRMGRHDQVARFYGPIASTPAFQALFLQEAKLYTPGQWRTVRSALADWSRDDALWEPLATALGVEPKQSPEEATPASWPPLWQKRLARARLEGGDYCISKLFWKGTLKRWLEELDFLLAVLALDLGPHWRQVDTLTNPLRFYARLSVYPSFLSKLNVLPGDQQAKILAAIQRANPGKAKQIRQDLQTLAAQEHT